LPSDRTLILAAFLLLSLLGGGLSWILFGPTTATIALAIIAAAFLLLLALYGLLKLIEIAVRERD
jgi:hypothetical protein